MERLNTFYKNKKVLVTGNTGFKGSWMSFVLKMLGAEVYGYSLNPPTHPSLFEIAEIDKYDNNQTVIGDVRDLNKLSSFIKKVSPDIAIHTAAQPLVRFSYENPVLTYETNILGTVNFLESLRFCNSIKSSVIVTTDKVYKNKEWIWSYREVDELGGHDPYSNSKACCELVVESYKKSFFFNSNISISTARAGNVIGGGDFADNRIIPDCVRSVIKGERIAVRNPKSVRPFQHVLEPIFAYLVIAMEQYNRKDIDGSYNIGPDSSACITTGELVGFFCNEWGDAKWDYVCEKKAVHEANLLQLDATLAKEVFGIKPIWNTETAIKKTVEWTKCWVYGDSIRECMTEQVKSYIKEI